MSAPELRCLCAPLLVATWRRRRVRSPVARYLVWPSTQRTRTTYMPLVMRRCFKASTAVRTGPTSPAISPQTAPGPSGPSRTSRDRRPARSRYECRRLGLLRGQFRHLVQVGEWPAQRPGLGPRLRCGRRRARGRHSRPRRMDPAERLNPSRGESGGGPLYHQRRQPGPSENWW